ncbi:MULTISPECIES: hypothetical protein [unclassified Streptomyces]|uniref:hypothetical protein n=1 Tax=unclassified Streptomyces TaxID=2593676 RepID=UPI0029BF6CA8|nr:MULTISPECIES: hypothetical protein [unclassified Streptomyces]MDX3766347.1 hypothetical protein [Streptomyces sp. AK08-01B]MDX3816397.1 hypothetical protein [Streptomyces sp. AK08-01A]
MDISRTVRIVAAGGLAVLAGFFAAGQVHTQADIVAGDTTWSSPVDTIPGPPAETIPASDDTTWSVPVDPTPAPDDTTWSVPADTTPAPDDTTSQPPVDGGLGDGPVLATPNDTTWGW